MTVLEITGAGLRQAMERSAEYFDLDGQGRLKVADSFLKPRVEVSGEKHMELLY